MKTTSNQTNSETGTGPRLRPGLSSDEVVARNQAARNNSRPLFDPHGIYGARTAYRVRTAQRRRQIQALVVLTAFAAVSLIYAKWASDNRVPTLRPFQTAKLSSRPAGFPAWGAEVAPGGAAGKVWLLVGSETGALVPLDVGSGKQGTPFRSAFPFRAQPLVVGATAFAAGEDGSVYAVDWTAGRKLWSFKSQASVTTRAAYWRPEVAAPAAPLAAPTNLTAGELTSAPGGEPTGASSGAAVIASPRALLFVGDDEGGLSALDAASGRRIWSQAVRAPIGNGLTVASGAAPRQAVVLAPVLAGQGTQGGVLALQATTGRVLWRDALGCGFLPAPVVGTRDGNVVVYAVGEDGSVVCLDGASGRKIWRTVATPLPGAAGAVVLHGEPLLVSYPTGEVLVCGGGDGGVRCFDAASGSALWTFEAGSAVRCRPRALSIKSADGTVRDVLLVGTDGACAYAIDAHMGTPLWKCRTSGIAFATPGFYQGTVSCLTHEGTLETFKVPA